MIEKRSALIVVAQIGLYRTRSDSAPRELFVASILLADSFGRVLAFFKSISIKEASRVAPGVRALGANFHYKSDMRRELLNYLRSNNVLVGFHVGWTSTAFSLALPGSRVVDLGTEEAFQLLSQNGLVAADVEEVHRRVPGNLPRPAYPRRPLPRSL